MQHVKTEDGEFTIEETCIGLQCISHRQHNGSGLMEGMLDSDFLDVVVSMVTKLLNDNVKGHVLTNVNHLLFEKKDVDARTTFCSACQKEIHSRSLLPQRCRYLYPANCSDLVPQNQCAMVRWATVQKSAASLDNNTNKYTFGTIEFFPQF